MVTYCKELIETSDESVQSIAGPGGAVNNDCIPFSAIPHASRLFLDFLLDFPRVSRFYQHRPTVEAVEANARVLAKEFPAERRKRVADVLERQNRGWGAKEATLSSIERLRSGAVAVISGQQVGLFGGPLYSLLKAASALQLARELTARGVDAVPVFWLATEDHDLAEINRNHLPSNGELQEFASTSEGDPGEPVGKIEFRPEIEWTAADFAELLGEGPVAEAVKSSYVEGETFGSAFARLFTQLFDGMGLILVDPLDAELHAITGPLMVEAAKKAEQIDRAILARGKELRDAGYHEQVKVTPSSTLLFSLEDSKRTVLHLAGEDFLLGARRIPREQLLERISAHPELFSPNVLLRPVVQDFLFPTAAYFGGPAETAYFAQAAVVYEELLGRQTPVLPRLSATIISGRMERLLRRYNLTIPDLFHGSEQLQETLAARMLPEGLKAQFEADIETLDGILNNLKESLQQLDPTLVDAAEKSGRKMHYQLARLSAKAARAELRRNQQLITDARLILTELFPERDLQERTLPGVYFLAAYGPELIERLVTVAAKHCPGHQLVRV